jgi:hypothetical protein
MANRFHKGRPSLRKCGLLLARIPLGLFRAIRMTRCYQGTSLRCGVAAALGGAHRLSLLVLLPAFLLGTKCRIVSTRQPGNRCKCSRGKRAQTRILSRLLAFPVTQTPTTLIGGKHGPNVVMDSDGNRSKDGREVEMKYYSWKKEANKA